MENENEDIITSENDEKTIEGEGNTDSKIADLEEKNRQLFARAKKAEGFELKEGKWIKSNPVIEKKPEVPEKPSGLDFGEKAYLVANGVKGKDEIELFGKYKDSGKDIDEILDESTIIGKLFKAEISELREEKTTKNAIPKGSKQSSPSQRDTADYWMSKPFSEVPENLKRDVLNKKIEVEKGGSRFSPNPIVAQ